MSTSNRFRWRERRDTLTARRHRRRRRRRDLQRSECYEPEPADPDSASRGVRNRLAGAMVAVALTSICIGTGLVIPLSWFAATFAFTLGFSSFGAGIALVLSARHEERVHELAAQLDAEDVLAPLPDGGEDPAEASGTDGTDGSLEPLEEPRRAG